MKNLLLLFFLLLSLNFTAQNKYSAAAKRAAQITKTVATVKTVISEQAVLQSRNIFISYQVPAGEFILGKEYVFWLEVTDCGKCANRKALVVAYTVTTNQAQRDMEEISEGLSNQKQE
jgi:hypothetical protein